MCKRRCSGEAAQCLAAPYRTWETFLPSVCSLTKGELEPHYITGYNTYVECYDNVLLPANPCLLSYVAHDDSIQLPFLVVQELLLLSHICLRGEKKKFKKASIIWHLFCIYVFVICTWPGATSFSKIGAEWMTYVYVI